MITAQLTPWYGKSHVTKVTFSPKDDLDILAVACVYKRFWIHIQGLKTSFPKYVQIECLNKR